MKVATIDRWATRLLGEPHRITLDGDPYLTRWYVWPRTRDAEVRERAPVRVFVHLIHRSDRERFLHDHPWSFVSFILSRTTYTEFVPARVIGLPVQEGLERRRFRPAFRAAEAPHRVTIPPGEHVVSLILCGRRRRTWGFHTDQGWVRFDRYDGVGEIA